MLVKLFLIAVLAGANAAHTPPVPAKERAKIVGPAAATVKVAVGDSHGGGTWNPSGTAESGDGGG